MMRFPHNPCMFHKVTIVGIGLLGGSLAMALKKNRLAREVVGVSRRQATLDYALKNKIIDAASSDVARAVHNADLVVLATPVKTIVSLLANIGKHLKRGCLVTDVGSTKSTIVDMAHKHLPPHVAFVGGHPLAGSEKTGVEFSQGQIFEKSFCIITPNDKTSKAAKEKVESLWKAVGCTVKTTTPDEHDKIIAYTSHVPHLVAYALMGAIPKEFIEFGSSGLRDTTRIAGSNPQMWNDICMENSKNILNVLDEVVKVLSHYRKAVATQNDAVLIEDLKQAKTKRDVLG